MLEINKTSNDVMMAVQNGFIAVAIMVFFVTLVICLYKMRRKEYDEIFMFSLSLTLSWFGCLSTKIWGSIWRYHVLNGDQSHNWMIGHWFPVVFNCFLVAGGLLHIRTLTRVAYKEKGWQVAAVIVSMVMFTSWIFFT